MFLIAAVFMMLSSIHAQTTLNPGDLVIVTVNQDAPDNFDFIPLVDIQAGTVINFTDNGLNTSSVLLATEGTITWTASTAVTKGTVVSFSGTVGGNWTSTGTFALSTSGDNLLVYQGAAATPSFIYGIGWGKTNVWAYTGANDSNIPAALSVASKTIVTLGTSDNYQYNGQTTGSAAQLLAMVAYAPYWNVNDATAYTAYATAFTINATTACTAPYALTATGMTSSSANLGWSTFGTETAWNIEYGVTGFTQGTGTPVTGVTNPYTLNGLSQNTTYQFYAKADCGGSVLSTWAGPFAFTTSCGAVTTFPHNETFASYLPSACWLEGDAGDITAGPTTISATASSWAADGFLNSGSTGAAKINIDLAVDNDWIISPEFSIPATPVFRLKYSVGATQYGATTAPTTAWESDDFVQVLISTTYPTNWTVLKTFTDANTPSNLGQTDVLDLSAYAGQNVRIAYRGVEGATDGGADIDFFIDNFIVEAVPSCEAPTALTATSVTAAGATLGWTAGATETLWNVEYGVTGFTHGTGTTVTGVTNPYPVTGLIQNTTYQFYVKADCGGSGLSAWAGPFSFTTLYSCPKPTVPTVTNVLATSADLGWTAGGTETAWIVYYKTAAATDYTEVTGVTTNPYTLGGLTANTNYIFKVKANCSVSDTSYVSVTKTFTTPCSAISSFPYTESYGSTFPSCWTASEAVAGASYHWATATADATHGVLGSKAGTNFMALNVFSASATYNPYYLTTPSFTLDATIKQVKYYYYLGSAGNTLSPAPLTVQISTDNGTTWTDLYVHTTANSTFSSTSALTGWVQNTVALTAYVNQTVKLRFAANSNYGSGYCNQGLDEFVLEDAPSCLTPTALTATALTATGATLGWTAGNTETLWNVEYSTTGFTQGTGTIANGVTNPYAITGLSQNTTYQFYVQADCGGSTSTWAGPFSFTTPYSCPKPTVPTVTNITATTADLGWTNGGTETAWIVYYKTAAATDYTEVTGVTTNPYTLGGLTPATNYIFKVKANCSVSDTSFTSATQTFTTLCNAVTTYPHNEPFTNYLPSTCWTEGVAGDLTAGPTTISSSASSWAADGFLNSGLTGAIKINIDADTDNDWIISPEFTIPATPIFRLKYSVGATQWNATTAPTTPWESDDFVQVLVSTTYPATWTVLKTFNDLNTPSNLGQLDMLDLSAYAGQTIRIAFRGVEGATNGSADIDFFVDDFTIEAVPTCEAPTALTATAITSTGATLGWTAGGTETLWNVEYGVTGFTQGAGTTVTGVTNPYAISGLTSNTTYQFYVKSDCGGTGLSTWAGPFSFTTTCGAVTSFPFIENFNSVTTPNLPNCFSQIDGNTDGTNWITYTTYGVSGSQCAGLYTDYNAGDNNDFLVLPQMTLNGNQQLKFSVRARSTTEPNDYKVVLSTTDNLAASFTTELKPLTEVSSTTMTEIAPINLSAYTGDVWIAVQVPAGGLDGYYLYVDDITVENIPTCTKPTALTASSITASDATISWTRGATETAWNVEYGPVGFTQGAGTVLTGVADTAYALADLTSATSYSFYVQADCGIANGQSAWAGPYTFITLCSNATAFVENFDAVTTPALPTCWAKVGTDGSANTQSYTANSTPNTLYMYGLSVVSMPPVSNAGDNTHWLRFNMRANYSEGGIVEIGYLTNPTDAASFVSVTTKTASSLTYAEYTADLGTAPGANTILAIRHSDSPDYSLLIDDVKWEVKPSCLPPTAGNTTSLTSTGATLAWTAGATETQWNVEYGATGYTQGTGTAVVANTNSTTISGLTANTAYQFYVQANCGGTDGVSTWAGPFSIYTGYCIPAPTSVDGDGISNVTFSTVNNTITAIDETYGDYTAMVGDVQQSAIVPVDITYVTGYTYDTKIWIDWNNDLDFNDAGEEVYEGTSISDNPTTLNASFTVPATAPLGQHRMRIGGQDSGPAEPCYNGSYGVFEDYTVNVTSGTTVCATPTALAATNIAETTADLGWTSTAANFNVRYRTVGATTWSVATATSTTLPLAGLTANTQYEFEVQAVCSATAGDTSAWATAATFTTIVASSCPTPTALTATNITLTSADLGWTSTAANFNVRYRIVGAATWTTSTLATTTLPLTGLTEITQYEFQVQAICSATAGDTSNWTSTTNFTTLSSCATPTALAATNIAQTTATLGWASTAANFNVRYRTVGSSTWTNTTASAITLPVTGLTANTQYEFQVQAACSATVGDTSAWATAVTFTTLAMPACATPTALAATNVAQTTATLGWTSTAANFNVRYRTVGSATWTSTTASAITLPVTGLTANTQYEFQVQAVCSATAGDTSAWATAATFTTLAVGTCPEPTALVVSAISEVGATLNWTAGGTETAWNLRYKKVADATYTNVANTSTKPYILTALQSSTAYVWNVQAVCSGTLTSIWSADNTFTTTVGIESNSISALKVYSFENQVNVINNGNLLVKEVVIYDVLGQEVGKFAINSTDNILINTNLTIGNYVVKVITPFLI